MVISEVRHVWESKSVSNCGEYNHKTVSKCLLPTRMFGLKTLVRYTPLQLWNYMIYLLES